MITPQLFKQHSLSEKLKLIKRFGTHVATRRIQQHYVQLHALDKMMVEVWYTRHLYWKRSVKVRVGSSSDELLEPYLDMIHLDLDFD